jgi:hypothetical protein
VVDGSQGAGDAQALPRDAASVPTPTPRLSDPDRRGEREWHLSPVTSGVAVRTSGVSGRGCPACSPVEAPMSETTTVMIPEPMPPFGAVHLAAAGYPARYSAVPGGLHPRPAHVLRLVLRPRLGRVRHDQAPPGGRRPLDVGGARLRPRHRRAPPAHPCRVLPVRGHRRLPGPVPTPTTPSPPSSPEPLEAARRCANREVPFGAVVRGSGTARFGAWAGCRWTPRSRPTTSSFAS